MQLEWFASMPKVKHVFSTVRGVSIMHVGSHEWVLNNSSASA